ncbi:hypothetical protein [Nitrosopumilus piranensis]|uniref:Uncharacterized protein n=1 Tax=Nitrosopumilus piranensis TaxID=1582439 RepID=A0A0C5BUI4_9ARCH|nr:hypothetical protein [Nitrosopumilus piranensis]AJM91916.1 hypothetical protein NPIRD3C_0702 [Nitrosopumilus piranensis]
MNNFNYFFTPVGPEYKKKFARNVGIAVLILFVFYGIMHLIGDISKPEETKMINDTLFTIPSAQEFLNMDCENLNHFYPEFPSEDVADAWITRMHECINEQEKVNDKHKVIELFKNTPEVKAFHMQYENARTSLRDDHISYFSGSEDGYLVRMNLFFDENNVMKNMDFHCYYQKVHQFELPQEDLVSKIEKYDCKEFAELENENYVQK